VPELADRVVEELVGMGLLRSRGEVLWARTREVQYANVVFDQDRAPSLAIIEPWLASHGILTAGRYGKWAYLWTDDAVLSGFKAAEDVLASGAPT
jgi:protoporphyrinogen oxidase